MSINIEKQHHIIELVNITKTKVIIFRKKKGHILIPVLKMNGVNLDTVNDYKYLGNILKNNLTESSELERITESINISVGIF